MRFRLSRHAKREIERRNIPADLLDEVLSQPQQVVAERSGRKVYQSRFDFGCGKIYLLRAVVADDVDPAVVVTAYKMSKIDKYWSVP